MPVLREKPALETLKGLEFHHCPGLADRGGHTGWEWAVTSASWLPPSLSSCTAKGAWKTANASPIERDLISVWKKCGKIQW